MLRLYPAMLRNNVWQFAPSIRFEEIVLRSMCGRSNMPVLNGRRTRGSLDVLPKLWVENRGRSPVLRRMRRIRLARESDANGRGELFAY